MRLVLANGKCSSIALAPAAEEYVNRYADRMTQPKAYYSENDPFAAAWLRELIKEGHIAPGDVDERSIEDVSPADVMGYTQCHFFAGIGVWSYALRLAGWSDDRPVWTGSCPCPSFSAAGKGTGFDDPRHLWPAWFRLIRERRPPAIFGEQADDAIGYGWLDLVQSDMETEGYAVGKAVLGACCVGSPHIRQRLYFVAESRCEDWEGRPVPESRPRSEKNGSRSSNATGGPGTTYPLAQNAALSIRRVRRNGDSARNEGPLQTEGRSASGELEHPECLRHEGRREQCKQSDGSPEIPGPVSGFWRDAEWLPCRDGKARAVEPGTFPLAHGAAARMGRLRGYGNAVVAPLAQAFIEAYIRTAANARN